MSLTPIQVRVVKGSRFWTRKSKGRALILYNFELNNLKALLGCEETARIMAHYHPYIQVKSNQSLLQRKGSGKEIRRHVNMTCSLGTSWPFPLVLFCVAYSHTGWKHLASAASLKLPDHNTACQLVGTITLGSARCVDAWCRSASARPCIGEMTYQRAARVGGQHKRL